MAHHLISILGDLLYKDNIEESEFELPSPAKLRNKILVKAKRLPKDGEEVDSAEIEEEEDEIDQVKKQKPKKISQQLSDLVNYIHAVHFHGFDDSHAKFYHMSSFGESKTKSILSDPEQGLKFVNYNTRQISR